MQSQRTAGGIAANLQHLASRDSDRWAAAVVGGVRIRDQRVQRVVAAAKVDDNETTGWQPLRLRDCSQESRGGEAKCDRRNAVTDEDSSRYAHGRSYSYLDELVLGGANEKTCKTRGPGRELRGVPAARSRLHVRHQRLLRNRIERRRRHPIEHCLKQRLRRLTFSFEFDPEGFLLARSQRRREVRAGEHRPGREPSGAERPPADVWGLEEQLPHGGERRP